MLQCRMDVKTVNAKRSDNYRMLISKIGFSQLCRSYWMAGFTEPV